MTPASGFLALFSLFLSAVPAVVSKAEREGVAEASSSYEKELGCVYTAQSPFGWSHTTSETHEILWENCSTFDIDSQDPNLACAYHEVPMDYHNPRAGKARLAVARYAATAPQKLGTLFTIPGGPWFIAHGGQHFSTVFDGAYDIVSWDPRGFGPFTFPGPVTCFESWAEEEAFFQNTIVQSINHTIAGGFDKQDLDELFSRTEESSRLLLEFGERCQHGPAGKFLQYIGTSSTVRDLASLGDRIVGKGEPINYWGITQHGTAIGINFINMFPERAGHVILDGVIDPNTWVSHKTPRTALLDAEKAYSTLTDACAASGKAGCRLVELVGDHANGQDIKRLINDAHDTALRLLRAGFDQLPITPGEMKVAFHAILGVPGLWSEFVNEEAFDLLVLIFQAAQALDISYNGTYQVPSGAVKLTTRFLKDNNPTQDPIKHTFEAIIGADNFFDIENHVVMKDVLDEIVDITRTVTPTFGAIWRFGRGFGWPVRSVERLPPFNFSRVKNPVLVIGNTADPFTPFAGAQATANLLGNHVMLVEQLSVGHASLSRFSSCTIGIITDYVLTSKLPDVPNGEHIKCEVDPGSVLFPPINTSTRANGGSAP